MQVRKYLMSCDSVFNESGVYSGWTGLRIILTFSGQFGIQTHTNHPMALLAQHAEKHDITTTRPL